MVDTDLIWWTLGAEGKEVPLLEWGTAEEAAAAAAATQGQQTPTREQQAQQQAEILLDQVCTMVIDLSPQLPGVLCACHAEPLHATTWCP